MKSKEQLVFDMDDVGGRREWPTGAGIRDCALVEWKINASVC